MEKPTPIRPLAARVAEEHAVYEEARMDNHKAAGDLLAQVLCEVLPALPAIMDHGLGGQPLPMRLTKRGPRFLMLYPDGSLAEIVLDPDADVPSPVKQLTPYKAVERGWLVAEVIETLVTALEAQVAGNKAKAVLRMLGNTSRLRAALQLLQDGVAAGS